jgi:two-component system chemotaxis response regulator CheY
MKILLLNNDLAERSLIQQVLLRGGHQLLTAETSQAAWEILQEGAVRFMIADRSSTDMDATGFIERIRSAILPASIYILLVSARSEGETPTFPADDYLFKPVSPSDLRSRIAIGERILTMSDNLVQAKGQLENLALRDPLTNLLSEKAFLPEASGELERARRLKGPISLVMLDVDNYQAIAAQHGQELANDLLALVGQVIREKSRPYDCIGRWGSNSFVTVLPNVIGEDAEKVAARILTSMRAMNVTPRDGSPLRIQMSAGVAAISHITAVLEIASLIEYARQAMLRARESGGDQVFVSYS